MQSVEQRRKSLKFKAKGYWFKTFERLLALETLLNENQVSFPIVHLENDILFFGSQEQVHWLGSNLRNSTAVRWANQGNCGFLFIPTREALGEFLSNLHIEAKKQALENSWSIDIPIIGRLLDSGQLDSLQTKPIINQREIPLVCDEKTILGDSSDIGTYLFGLNPVYTDGIVAGGHRYDHVDWEINRTEWRLSLSSNPPYSYRLEMKLDNKYFDILFLHINSKLNLAKHGALLLRNAFPLNHWMKEPFFPSKGFRIESIHKESAIKKFVARLYNLLAHS